MTASRIAGFVFALVLIAAGFLCLNYTKGFGMEHHVQWAEEHGAPPPSYLIFLAGAGLEVVGAGLGGLLLGRRPRVAAGAAP